MQFVLEYHPDEFADSLHVIAEGYIDATPVDYHRSQAGRSGPGLR
ncbi:hypothetical protein ABFA25_04975 [Mycobacterium lepromatosis]